MAAASASGKRGREEALNAEAPAHTVVKAPRREATLLSEPEVGLLLDDCCSQLDELAKQLEDAKARVLRTIAAALQRGVGQPDPARRAEPVPAQGRARKHRTASSANSSSVIVLDSDDEGGENEDEQADPSGSEGSSHQLRADGGVAADGSHLRLLKELPPRPPPPPPAHDAPDADADAGDLRSEDDEPVFVSSTGITGGDLPHPRVLCPKHVFRAGDIDNVSAEDEALNLLCCELCYCFLCDVSSKECKRWAGSKWLSHCNAHAGNELCKDVRAIARSGLATCPLSFDDALGLDARQVKSAHESMLKWQLAFDLYKKGQDGMAYDQRRRAMCVVKKHELHLGALIVPIASRLRFSFDAQLLKHGAPKMLHEKFHLEGVTALLCECLYCLATVLSNRYTREGQSELDSTVQAARKQFQACVSQLSCMLAVALHIIAMHGSVPASSGVVSWQAVREAVSEQLQRLFQHIQESRGRFPVDASWSLEEQLKETKKVVGLSSWSVAEVARWGSRAVCQALLICGSPEHLEEFVSRVAISDDPAVRSGLFDTSLMSGLVQRGLLDTACDVLLAVDTPVNKSYFYEMWENVFRQSPDAGMRLALRGVYSKRAPIHRPENERFDPILSARCEILRKAISEIRKRQENGESSAWKRVWAGDSQVPLRQGSQEFFESITSIRSKARRFLDEAGFVDEHGVDVQTNELSRHSCLSGCPDGTLSSPEGRLLFFEVCIEAFSRIHAPVPLCTELQRMSDFLGGDAYSLLSLMNSLRPKPACSGGPLRQRRRDILQRILQHSAMLTAFERVQISMEIGLGLGGWVELREDVVDDSTLKLTVALDSNCLDELQRDDLQGPTAVNAAISRFVLRQAQEGRVKDALAQARRMLQVVKRKHADKEGSIPAQSSLFWASLFQLAPFCAEESLRSDLAQSCFRNVPCAASTALLVLNPPRQQTVLDVRKYVEAGFGLSSAPWPLGFGSLAILGFVETSISALAASCRRQSKRMIFSECTEIIRCLGPLALDANAFTAGNASDCGATGMSWLTKIQEIVLQNLPCGCCKGFLEMEVLILRKILQVGAKIEPGLILPILRQHADAVAIKVLHECSRKQSAQRFTEIRAQFVEWLSALKETYHTRPAVVPEEMRHLWKNIAVVHAQRTWPGAVACAEQPKEPARSTLYRVRGPSLSSEWDSLVADLKVKVGRKANIWRDVKSAGIAQ